jgi:geranylgeranyl reductase family protein
MNHADADVIVVGAGPAGSTAAAVLSRQGLRVLLVDCEQFPRDKACGDLIPMRCFLDLRQMGLAAFDFERFPITQIVLQGSGNRQRTFPLRAQEGVSTSVVSRSSFDYALLQHAVACGAEYRLLHVNGPLLDQGHVIGVAGEREDREVRYFSPIVIGADGATSAIARGLGAHQKRHDRWAVALRGYVECDAELDGSLRLAFLDHLQPGYAWFFPAGTHYANVGVGMRSDYYKRQGHSLRQLLADYLALPDIAAYIGRNPVEKLQAWPVPFFSFEQQRVFDGALLAGDAGGFVHPITAAGIYPAIVTGMCAAEAAIHALATGDTSRQGLSIYDRLWQRALADDFKAAVTANKVASILPHLVSSVLFMSQPSAAASKPEDGAAPPPLFNKF